MDCYAEAYNQKEKNKITMIDYNSWLIGVYVAKAISSCFERSCKYPDKPFGIIEQKPMTLEEARKIEENKIRQYMSGGGRNGR